VSIILFTSTLLPLGAATLDLVKQFRNGCDYGFSEQLGGAFQPYAKQDAMSVKNVMALLRSGSYPASGPYVALNVGASPAALPFGSLSADLLHLRSGMQGEYSVVRCAIPVAGSFRMQGEFVALDGAAAAVHILHNSERAFSATITQKGEGTKFDVTRAIVAGDRISFVVGPSPTGAGGPASVGLRGTFDVAPPPSSSAYKDALQAAEAKDYDKAHRLLSQLAEQGHVMAQYNLGVLHHEGLGVPQDDTVALRWWLRAAAEGNAVAQYQIGMLYKNGEGVKQDSREAFKWFQMAADRGMGLAQMNLGEAYEDGLGVPVNKAEAYRWNFHASRQGITPAAMSLTLLAGEGGVYEERHKAARTDDPDESRLRDRLTKAAPAVRNAVAAYDDSEYEKAMKLLAPLAEAGDVLAQFYLARMYAGGYGAEEDEQKAVKWDQAAAAQGLDRPRCGWRERWTKGLVSRRTQNRLPSGIAARPNTAIARLSLKWASSTVPRGS
jgi:TPR repeat protein